MFFTMAIEHAEREESPARHESLHPRVVDDEVEPAP